MPYFFQILGKMSQNLSSAASVIGALRVNVIQISVCASREGSGESGLLMVAFTISTKIYLNIFLASGDFCCLLITL